jgi:hypothetical protein
LPFGTSHRLPLLDVIKQIRPLLIATTAAWETHFFLEDTVLLLGGAGGLIAIPISIGGRAATTS